MATSLYVNTAFENGSPLDWEVAADGALELRPLYDYERGSSNRQLTHWHFRLCGDAGQTVRLRFPPRQNIYNGRRVNAFAKRIGNRFSADGVHWSPFVLDQAEDGSLAATLVLPADEVLIARIEPYTTQHLAALLDRLRGRPHVRLEVIGRTVDGRDLELITLSSGPDRPLVFFRGRAHPWEAGGNWFLDGLISGALADPAVLGVCDVAVLPMAGKDGVVRGQTRFNVNGYDLNRGFVAGHDFGARGVPENQALMDWLAHRRSQGALPRLAVDLHDDDHGNLHVGHRGENGGYDRRMGLLDELMRRHTYYREGMTRGSGVPTFGEGLLELFGIDSLVYELNSNWLAGADTVPGSTVWREFGAQFAHLLTEYVPAAQALRA